MFARNRREFTYYPQYTKQPTIHAIEAPGQQQEPMETRGSSFLNHGKVHGLPLGAAARTLAFCPKSDSVIARWRTSTRCFRAPGSTPAQRRDQTACAAERTPPQRGLQARAHGAPGRLPRRSADDGTAPRSDRWSRLAEKMLTNLWTDVSFHGVGYEGQTPFADGKNPNGWCSVSSRVHPPCDLVLDPSAARTTARRCSDAAGR